MFNKIKLKLIQKLQAHLLKMSQSRAPDFTVGQRYLKRWYIWPRNPICNAYYHIFKASDDPRFLHDHFYINCSILMHGSYKEHMVDGVHQRVQGDIVFRLPKTLHRIEIDEGDTVATLFITGPRVRMWGFLTDEGWLPHEEYVAKYGTNPNI